jgi:SAM-dependent methyltransferase
MSDPGDTVGSMTETADALALEETRASYDTVAADYADLLRHELAGAPLERAMLAAFAELALAAGAGPVGDLGCGPGRVTAHLHALGVDAFGVDLSSGMVEVARADHPGLRFEQGSMTALDLVDGALGGVLSWYSTVHTPPEQLPAVFAEYARVLAPGAPLLIAFKAGEGGRRLEHAYRHPVSLDVYYFAPERVSGLLAAAGLDVRSVLIREPGPDERTPQGYLLARKPAAA